MLSTVCRIPTKHSFRLPIFARNRTTVSTAGLCRRFPPLRTFSTVKDSSQPGDTAGASETVVLQERNTLFIGRLPHVVRKDQARAMLRTLFRRFGRITAIKVATDLQGNPRQYAHISFEDPESAATAFKVARKEPFVMKERILNVDMAPVPNKKHTEDVRRQLHFCGLEGDERTIRKVLSKITNSYLEFIRLMPPNENGTRDGCIQMSTPKWARITFQRLIGCKKKKKMVFHDMWHASTRAPVEEAAPSLAPEAATSSPAAESSSPSTSQLPDESLEEPESGVDPHARQLFIGSLPIGLTERQLSEQIKKLFQPFGQIKWLRIGYGPEHDAQDNAIPFCHLEFLRAETALDAFKFSRRERMKINRQEISIALKKIPRPSNTLYFRAYFGSRLSLWDTVREFEPNIRRIVFFNDRSGVPSGDGQIEFKTLEHATEALPALHGRIAKNGTRLLLSYHRPSRRGTKAHCDDWNRPRPGPQDGTHENEPKSETV